MSGNVIDFSKVLKMGNGMSGNPNQSLQVPMNVPIIGKKPDFDVYMIDDDKIQTIEDIKIVLKMLTAKMVIPVPSEEQENFTTSQIYPFVKRIDINDLQQG